LLLVGKASYGAEVGSLFLACKKERHQTWPVAFQQPATFITRRAKALGYFYKARLRGLNEAM